MADFYSKTWKDHVPWVLGVFLAAVAVAVLAVGGNYLWSGSPEEVSEEPTASSADSSTGIGENGEGEHGIGTLFVGDDGDGPRKAANVAVGFATEATSLEYGTSPSVYYDRLSEYTDEELTSRLSVDETVNELHEDLESWEEDLAGNAQIYRIQADGTGKIDVSVHLHTAAVGAEYDLGPMTVSLSATEQGVWEVHSVYRPIH